MKSSLLMNCLWYEDISPEELANVLELTPEADCDGYEAVRFEYDEQSRLLTETYQDFSGNPVCVDDTFSITHYSYGTMEAGRSYVDEFFADVQDVSVPTHAGSSGRRTIYDDRFRILEIGSIDKDGLYEPMITAKWGEDGVPCQLILDEVSVGSGSTGQTASCFNGDC